MAKATAKPDRDTVLNRTRALKMARSTHAYVRGNTAQFYEWLAASAAVRTIPQGPPVWICGDCHLGNLGPVADADGWVDVQIRDLDQTVIGNPAHDVIRLALSLATAARGSDLPGVATAHMIEAMVDGYETALAEPDANCPMPEPDAVRSVRRRSLGRRWRHLASERLEDVEPTIPLGKRFWKLTGEERAALEALIASASVRALLTSLAHRDSDEAVDLIDAAYWMKGCSSLGKLRYAALVEIGQSKKSRGAFTLVDIKEAVKTVAPSAPDAKMPRDIADRVVAGACALAPNLGERMLAVKLLGKPVVLRELLPQDLKLEIDQFTRAEAIKSSRYLAYVVGRAHASQMDKSVRAAWRRALLDHRGAGIDAPSWLWRTVVELLAQHEAGYLEHCRRFALAA